MKIELTPEESERFWSKVDTTGECWEWQAMTRTGYGLFRFRGKSWGAHRLSYALENDLDINLQVCHSCDSPPCVNPAHLFQGTARANNDDRNAKGRHAFSLTNEQVIDIRSRPLSSTMCKDLAEEFGSTTRKIKKVLTGEAYGWLPGAREIPEQFTAYKLTPEQVDDIIRRSESGKWGIKTALAEEYGITKGHVSHITNNRLLYTRRISDE